MDDRTLRAASAATATRACDVGEPTDKDLRHRCRHPRCRGKLKVPTDNPHHAFCTRGCHGSFYRSRCLVCEEEMVRKNERQKFRSGHTVCEAEHRKWAHKYDYPSYPTSIAGGARFSPIKSAFKKAIGSSIPVNLLGGYRFPDAPRLDPDLVRKILRAEVGAA